MQVSWPQPNEQWLVVVFGAKAKNWDPEIVASACALYALAAHALSMPQPEPFGSSLLHHDSA